MHPALRNRAKQRFARSPTKRALFDMLSTVKYRKSVVLQR
ncbi:hypothetical protein BURMUCF2_A1090 [Burkholderia multivorans CF2]|nr:hypothetical protein BURMUCF2_A1090 [Burkholderia multivorans CF2]